ncbi:uncharacterized protein METZ01_LOCUS121810, partial [marine metagenome]
VIKNTGSLYIFFDLCQVETSKSPNLA